MVEAKCVEIFYGLVQDNLPNTCDSDPPPSWLCGPNIALSLIVGSDGITVGPRLTSGATLVLWNARMDSQ
jgi:hypothetical protein